MEPTTPPLEHTEQDRPDVALLTVIGVAGILFLLVVVFAVQALFFSMDRAEEVRKDTGIRPATALQQRAEQQQLIGAYRWIDQKGGVVGIPIERAMELLVKEHGR